MTATLVRIVFDTAGELTEIIKPDYDGQLNDPRFARSIFADVSASDYAACTSRRDELALAQPEINDATVAGLVTAEIQAIDDAITAQQAAAAAALEAWLEAHPGETP